MTAEEMIEAIRAILDQPYNDAYALQQIRRVLAPPIVPKPVVKDERGWPELGGGAVIELPDSPQE